MALLVSLVVVQVAVLLFGLVEACRFVLRAVPPTMISAHEAATVQTEQRVLAVWAAIKKRGKTERLVAMPYSNRTQGWDAQAGMLTKACQALRFLNNRYCKKDSCNQAKKKMIYQTLKLPLIRWLLGHGYGTTVECSANTRTCYWCNGSGIDIAYRMKCTSCKGTGIYRPDNYSKAIYGFHFMVNGVAYGWHVPARDVSFSIPSTALSSSRSVKEEFTMLSKTYSDDEAIAIVRNFLALGNMSKAA